MLYGPMTHPQFLRALAAAVLAQWLAPTGPPAGAGAMA